MSHSISVGHHQVPGPILPLPVHHAPPKDHSLFPDADRNLTSTQAGLIPRAASVLGIGDLYSLASGSYSHTIDTGRGGQPRADHFYGANIILTEKPASVTSHRDRSMG
jgi:hypothetical protein